MTKRQFGTVRKLPSGRWQARMRDDAGRMMSAPVTFATKGDATRWLAGAQADVSRGDWRDPRLGQVTFAEWAKRWSATTVHLATKTRINYTSALTVHLLPTFGARPVASIDTPAVRTFVAGLQASGLSAGTIQRVRAVLRLVLATAVEGGALKSNPCIGVKVPRTLQREPVFLTPVQIERLAASIESPPRPARHPARHYPEYALLVRLTAYTGLRAGEIAGLKVGRLNLLRGRLEVVEAMEDVAGGVAVLKAPKTYERRTVPVPHFLCDALTVHVAGRSRDDFVFNAPGGGPLDHDNFYARHFQPAVVRAGLPVGTRFHDLRHTCAALMVGQGAHPLAVMRRLGHSSITTTLNIYGHLFPEVEEAITDRLDELGRAVEVQPPAPVVDLPGPKRTARSGTGVARRPSAPPSKELG